MANEKVTLYFWSRDSTLGFATTALNYSMSAVHYLARYGLFHISQHYFINKEKLDEAKQRLDAIIMPCVGHVSLQTRRGGENDNGIYASFWPKETNLTPVDKVGIAGGLVFSLERDMDLEGGVMRNSSGKITNNKSPRAPDRIIHLNQLSVDNINQAYQEFKTNIDNCNWALWGSATFRNERTRNCAGLIEYLLNKGGFDYRIKRNNITYDPYIQAPWMYSALASASINGIVWGTILDGKRGAAIYSITAFTFVFLTMRLLSNKNGFHSLYKLKEMEDKGSNLTTQTESKTKRFIFFNTTDNSNNISAIDIAFNGGFIPASLWAFIKSVKIGYKVGIEYGHDKFLQQISIGFGIYLLAALLYGSLILLCTFPINLAISAITGVLTEGTGLILTPGGLLQLVEYAKKAELLDTALKMPTSISTRDIKNIVTTIIGASIVFASAIYMVSDYIDDTLNIPSSFKIR